MHEAARSSTGMMMSRKVPSLKPASDLIFKRSPRWDLRMSLGSASGIRPFASPPRLQGGGASSSVSSGTGGTMAGLRSRRIIESCPVSPVSRMKGSNFLRIVSFIASLLGVFPRSCR